LSRPFSFIDALPRSMLVLSMTEFVLMNLGAPPELRIVQEPDSANGS
jgi:hypothetical protein